MIICGFETSVTFYDKKGSFFNFDLFHENAAISDKSSKNFNLKILQRELKEILIIFNFSEKFVTIIAKLF